jgi:hypothetical protein
MLIKSMQDQNYSGLFSRHKMIFSLCDICEKAYEAPETEIYDPSSCGRRTGAAGA